MDSTAKSSSALTPLMCAVLLLTQLGHEPTAPAAGLRAAVELLGKAKQHPKLACLACRAAA